ncbi:MAG TPA: hypothetical protein VKI20_02260 [Acidimicrobiales bacterium]|nr:hypothetical protein [Acidimicrobiales bacterium]
MLRNLPKLGGQLGAACVVAGVVIIGLAWNGAASVDFVQGQVPYLLSGGALGLALCVLGASLIVVQSNRRDRSLLEAQLRELNSAVARLATAVAATAGASAAGNGGGRGRRPASTAEQVVVGRSSYHRPQCRLAEGKDLPVMSAEAAEAEGLSPCRICQPATPVAAG